MFLDYLKGFLVKKTIKNSLLNVKSNIDLGKIKTVGLIIDENYFKEIQSLLNQIIENGIAKEGVELLLFKSRYNAEYPVNVINLKSSHLNWNAQITNKEVCDFLEKDFDLLVNYYDVEKAILLVATHQSKAKFKVGFSNIDKRLNNFMININLENYKGFVQELFKYLKILNKI